MSRLTSDPSQKLNFWPNSMKSADSRKVEVLIGNQKTATLILRALLFAVCTTRLLRNLRERSIQFSGFMASNRSPETKKVMKCAAEQPRSGLLTFGNSQFAGLHTDPRGGRPKIARCLGQAPSDLASSCRAWRCICRQE